MDEQTYERTVAALESKYARSMADTARNAYFNTLSNGLSNEDAAENARQAVFNDLIDDDRWSKVEVTDIRDIADNAAYEVVREEESTTHEGL